VGRRERDAVVGADRLRQAKVLEGPLEDTEGVALLRVDKASQASRYRVAKSVMVSG
jgi:hypothetical protein